MEFFINLYKHHSLYNYCKYAIRKYKNLFTNKKTDPFTSSPYIKQRIITPNVFNLQPPPHIALSTQMVSKKSTNTSTKLNKKSFNDEPITLPSIKLVYTNSIQYIQYIPTQSSQINNLTAPKMLPNN